MTHKSEQIENLSTSIEVLTGACDLNIEQANKKAEVSANEAAQAQEQQAETRRIKQEKPAKIKRRHTPQDSCVLVHKRQEESHTKSIVRLKTEHQKEIEHISQWYENKI